MTANSLSTPSIFNLFPVSVCVFACESFCVCIRTRVRKKGRVRESCVCARDVGGERGIESERENW